ncbi:hypothetical protein [Burkholderia seminalis]|uniref:hypothetical protein n=1 Tax=Burkholderia seminalis TaxID=488731 RepID=UPI00264F750A|nr:hypothetical protein [Burkholderia seminalis]MDN7852576.1 hypothetical protein [Burkholderia seminalis]
MSTIQEISAFIERHGHVAHQVGSDFDQCQPLPAFFFSCLVFYFLVHADVLGIGPVSGKSRALSKQVYSIFHAT